MQRPRVPSRLSETVHQRLNSYALAARAAGVTVLALALPAEGKIVYTQVHHVITPGHKYNLDLAGRGVTDFTLINRRLGQCGESTCFTFRQTAPISNGAMGYYSGDHGTWNSALVAGVRVGPLLKNFHPGGGALVLGLYPDTRAYGQWVNVRNRYLGVRFVIKGKTHYGWARVSVRVKGTNLTATVTGYAYETVANKAIIAGKTKGPDVIAVRDGNLGHLAQGATAISIGSAEASK